MQDAQLQTLYVLFKLGKTFRQERAYDLHGMQACTCIAVSEKGIIQGDYKMRTFKFRYVWRRPDFYAGPYLPSDPKFKFTYESMDRFGYIVIRPADNRWDLLKDVNQFAGLTDKNGKEIYEGDLVQYSIEGIPQDLPMVIKIPNVFMELGHDDSYLRPDAFTFEVVINIYENPEMVKE